MDENADQSSPFWDLIQKQWRFLFNGAVWLFDIVATFVIPPAFLDESWINFTRFVVAVLTGLYSIAAATWPGRKHTAIWVVASVVFVVGATGSYFGYDSLLRDWTVIYPQNSPGRVLVGKTHTDFADAYRKKFRDENGFSLSDADLVWANDGTDGLWPEAEIEVRRRWAIAIYISTVMFPAFCIISVAQAITCASTPKSRSRKSRAKRQAPAGALASQ
jgi:hypothetical protein